MKRVVILGGGVAGLAAAFRILQLKPEWKVTILEQEERVGGLAVSMRNQEFSADLGPHRVFTELPEIQKLLPELISNDQMITVPRKSQLLLEGHLYQYPVKAGELLKQLGPVRMARFGFSAVAGKVQSILTKPDNYEEAMTHNFGSAAYKLLVGPYTRKVWKIEPSQLSEEVARVRVSAGNTNRLLKQLVGKREEHGQQTALSSFSYIRGGVEGLVRSLRDKVIAAGGEIRLHNKVSGFEANRGRVTSVTVDGDSSPIEADLFISTIPVTDLVELLQPLEADDEASKTAAGLIYIGLILVALIFKRPQFTENSWIYFPEEHLVFNRAYEPRNFDPSMAPKDRTMAVFEVTARWDSELWNTPDADLVEHVKRDLYTTGLAKPEEIDDAFAVRVPHTYPLYSTDYQRRLARVFSYLQQFQNLVTTGRQGLFNHNNMDHSMLMGIRAAEYCAQHDNVAARWIADLDQFSHFRIVD